MERKFISFFSLSFLILFLNVVHLQNISFNPQTFKVAGTPAISFGESDELMDSGFDQYEGGLTVYTSSGKVENIPLPSYVTSATYFYTETSSTVFVNDVRGGDKIDRLLKNLTLLVDGGYIENGRVRVLVLIGEEIWPNAYQLNQLDSATLNLFESYARGLNATVRSVQNKLPIIAVDLPYNYLYNLTQQEKVSHVFLDRKFYVCLDQSVPIIKPSDEMALLEQKFGTEINGTNIRIAITDTGIDKNHPDLEGKVILEASFTGENPTDGYGHGTHVASIAAGTGQVSDYKYVGVAPGALLMNAKVLTNSGFGYEEWIIAGVTWAVENSADIISMSLGANINGDGTDPMCLALDWATSQGVICVVAAGNAGQNGMFSVGTPAVAREIITVGATTKNDEIAYFSSQGLTSDYRLKPDVVAPGVDVVAARARGTTMGRPVDDHYTKASGTSMATPHVSGAAALILQVHADWTPKMVKASLMGNSKILDDEHLWRQGAGRINIAPALDSALLVVDPSVSFGAIRTKPANATLTVINLGPEEVHVDISAIGQVNWTGVNNIHMNVTSLNIPAYSNGSFSMSVNVTQADVGGWEEGWLNVTSTQRSNIVPFIALLSNYIEVNLTDEDGSTLLASDLILVTYPERKLVQFLGYNDITRPTSFKFLAKPGNYSIIASMSIVKRLIVPYPTVPSEDNSKSFMIEKFIQVPEAGGVLVNMSLAEARKCTIFTNTTEGEDLIVHMYKQAISGDPYYDEINGTTKMKWTHVNTWLAADEGPLYLEDIKGPITFYTSGFEYPEKLSQMFGFYGSKDLAISTVYLLAWKYYNTSIPSILRPSFTDLAKYHMYYDMPETYPVYLAVTSYIDFLGDTNPDYLSGWTYGMNRAHIVPAGLNATYYLTPEIASYRGRYYMHYLGFGPYLAHYPQEFWSIPSPAKGEVGCTHLGNFKIGPYVPGFTVKTDYTGDNSTIHLTGDIWANLTWPHEEWGPSPYPFWHPTYRLYVDESEVASGMLVRRDPDNPEKMFWDNLSFLWNVSGHRARLLVEMHGLLTISHSSIYQLEFDLNRNLTILPLLNDLTMPLNYSSGETLTVNSGFKEDILDVQLQYSYDYGKTWEDAASYSQNFEIPCLAKKQFAIRFNATDTMGNEYYYYTDPAALSRDVKVNLLEYNDTNILVKFTDIKDGNLSKTMVQCNINGSISFYMTDDDGLARINKPPLTEKLQLIFPSVGVYELKITEFYFRLKGDINSDGIVNINDIVLMSQAYGSKKGEPKWNPDADIAPPWNSIDIFDLVTCASYYGKKW